MAGRAEEMQAEVLSLEGKGHGELKEQYKDLTGEDVPKRMGLALLRLAVAYEIQRQHHKALSTRVDRQVSRLASKVGSQNGTKVPGRKVKPGGRLVREWRGKTYEVYVTDNGVFMEGKRYSSLSAVAQAITGAKWNGPRFFGLRSPQAGA